MKAVYVVRDPQVARVLVDPMRRAILSFLREKPMTQSQLADELGLSDASLNYHMKILKENGLVTLTKKVAEEHGIIQKFFSPAACLFVYDIDVLPKDIARYFYPQSLERARSVISMHDLGIDAHDSHSVDAISDNLSRLLVSTAKAYEKKKVPYGSDETIHEIYGKAIAALGGKSATGMRQKRK
ncbi:MAG: helix-turn-helix domain-containing protein [Nitrososphaera sp.]